MNPLVALGWNDDLKDQWHDLAHESFVPGRVIADFGTGYKIALPKEISADITGRLQYLSEQHEMPKVGDWVSVQVLDNDQGLIHSILPRKSEIGRKQPGKQFQKQVLAANVDIAFLVQALDHDFSPERMQRYLFQLSQAGVEPILVLNKADKGKDIENKLDALKSLGARVIIASAARNQGIADIAGAIRPGNTAIFLGSSGVGKSTITNLLLGEDRQRTQAVRETDSKGRHTTTHRELFMLPNGGLVIDTPGLRELQLWGTEDDLDSLFADVEVLTKQCRFSNCAHKSEPDCAILTALKSGDLDEARLESYLKFQDELRYLSTKVDENAALERNQSFKKSQKNFNQMIRGKKEI